MVNKDLEMDRLEIIKKRAEIVRLIRAFFDTQEFVEVHTPRLVKFPGQEPYLDPMQVEVENEKKERSVRFLITSPEFSCKKLLGEGMEKMYDLGPCFRNGEQFGGLHNPEFMMLEWYRLHADYNSLMDDIDGLLAYVCKGMEIPPLRACERMTIAECFAKYCDASLEDLLDYDNMIEWLLGKGYEVGKSEQYEDLFYRLFLNEIEPHLGKDAPTIVYDYPAQMSALARLSANDVRYAERCELYINGIELANGFSELVDPFEQQRRFEHEQKLRASLGKDVYPVDQRFIEGLASIPSASGIALGVDRLIMILLGCDRIDDVMTFPFSTM